MTDTKKDIVEDVKNDLQGEIIEDTNVKDENKKSYEDLVKENEELNIAKESLTTGIKELRTKKQSLEELIGDKDTEVLESKTSEENKAEELIREFKKEQADKNFDSAYDKFISSNPKFNPENDITGLLRKQLEKEMKGFNLIGLTTESEFDNIINKASRLVGGTKKDTIVTDNVNISTSTSMDSSNPSYKNDKEFSDIEKKLMDNTGLSEDRIKKMKESQPEMYHNIISQYK